MKILLLMLFLLTACGPKPAPPAVQTVAAQPLQPAYAPVASGQTLDVGFARVTVGSPYFSDDLRQGYAVLRPAETAERFCVLELTVENSSQKPLPTKNFLVRMTFPHGSVGGSAHCFDGEQVLPGESCRILLFAAVARDRPAPTAVRFLFHEDFAPKNGEPMPYRYLAQ